jgi:hypothetical protein
MKSTDMSGSSGRFRFPVRLQSVAGRKALFEGHSFEGRNTGFDFVSVGGAADMTPSSIRVGPRGQSAIVHLSGYAGSFPSIITFSKPLAFSWRRDRLANAREADPGATRERHSEFLHFVRGHRHVEHPGRRT